MKKVTSFEQYNELLRNARIGSQIHFSNNYNTPESINRFIHLERLYYHETDSGVIFIFDEERYYRICLYLDATKPFELPPLDKKALVRNIYKENKKSKALLLVEEHIKELGFQKMDTTVQVVGNTKEMMKKTQCMDPFVKKLEKAGFYCKKADAQTIDEIDQLLLDSGVIKDYHIDYLTPQEKAELVGSGYIGVFNSNGELCGGSAGYYNGKIANGIGVAIKEPYKKKGLTFLISYFNRPVTIAADIEYSQGWIVVDNKDSIEHHISAGYIITDKYADEWIKESY